MTAITSVVVVIPARNEEALVQRCLLSVQAAERYLALHFGILDRPAPTVHVVLVADGCTDATEEIAAGIPGVTVHSISASNVGAARAAGVEAALAVSRPDAGTDASTWICCTDADSVVPPAWILEQVRLAEAGFDLMIGTVRPEFSDLSPGQVRAWLATHVTGQPNGHVHGANLGVRAATYVRAGGFTTMPEHEDNDLVHRLLAVGARSIASDTVEVTTSGRRMGRTPGGYAGYLRSQLETEAIQAAEAARVTSA